MLAGRQFLIACLMLGGAAFAFQQNGIPKDTREADVYRIYSTVMTGVQAADTHTNPVYFIAGKTRTSGRFDSRCFHFPQDRQAEFRQIVQDYEKRKNTPRLLERKVTAPQQYELLNEDDVNAFVNDRVAPGILQGEPNPRFKLAADLFTFSDVYFSAAGTLAVVQLQSFCGGHCGRWEWKVFEKSATGDWKERPWAACVAVAELSR